MVAALGGAAFPAHIDRSSFSLLSNLGLWDPGLGFPLAEVSRQCPADFAASRPDLADVPLISGSDAHRLEEVGDRLSWMELPEKTAAAVLAWLRRGGPGVL
ncbi:hypothetical protein SDC9_169265 [bioreactor metagenome]|uniref:Histidinol-phosphatase n=1 Tax=bioreactor metagenome TaxID=1076179 RepID=A0A645GDH5_9ZZZZ